MSARIIDYVEAARKARMFAAMHRRPRWPGLRVEPSRMKLGTEAYKRGLAYLSEAKRIKREAMQ